MQELGRRWRFAFETWSLRNGADSPEQGTLTLHASMNQIRGKTLQKAEGQGHAGRAVAGARFRRAPRRLRAWWARGLSWQPKSLPVIDGDMIYVHAWEGGEVRSRRRPKEEHGGNSIRAELLEDIGRTGEIIAVIGVEEWHSLSA